MNKISLKWIIQYSKTLIDRLLLINKLIMFTNISQILTQPIIKKENITHNPLKSHAYLSSPS